MLQRVVALGIAWSLLGSLSQADDRSAIAALEAAGAVVKRDDGQKERPVISVSYFLRQVTPEGIPALKELETLPAIEFVGSGDTEVTPAMLRALQGKPSLKRLSIAFAKVNDESAAILGTLKTLDSLQLQKQIEISPAGCEEVLKLTNLKDLTLSGRLVNDYTLECAANCSKLKSLTIESVFVSDQGLQSLRRLRNLKTLRTYIGPEVTDLGLKYLADMNLTDLEITLLEVTNEKLKGYRKLGGLRSLKLVSAVKMTDESVPFVAELTELKELDLSDASLTKAGIKELKKALPGCKIVYDNIPRN